MGAWGSGPFDNDTAADWAYELVDAASVDDALVVLKSALSAAAEMPEGEYLDADLGSCAVAAASVVAAGAGHAAGDLPENIAEWLAAHGSAVPATLRLLASRALARTTSANSELAELWSESGDADEFGAELKTLSDALTAGG
jgi:hypothetical protein